MAKYVIDSAMDKMLRDGIMYPAAKMHVVRLATNSTLANIRSHSLASVAVDNSDFTIANGDSSGRKVTVAQQADLSIGTTATATHVCIVSTSELILKTTCTAQSLTSGGTVTVPAFDDEVADPT